jgi:adenylyltransferase/sulfurtransferase
MSIIDAPAPFSSTIDPADRYSRQTLFAPIGLEGQRRLTAAHVAIVGCGATGAAAASLLARAGIGTLTLIDRDFVEPSNLQRQVLFTESDALEALPKAEAACRRIAEFNHDVRVFPHIADLTPSNIHSLLADADLILDATDNFETRYLLNDFAIQQSKPWIYTAAIASYAATMNILPVKIDGAARTACLSCIFPAPPSGTVETCDTAGILNTTVNLAASLAVTEALKLLTGNAAAVRRTLVSFDLWTGERSEIGTSTPRIDCETCGKRNFPHLSGEGRPHITLCGRNSVQIHEHARAIDFTELTSRLSPHGAVRSNSMLLRFEHPPYVLTVFADGRALIQGTTDPVVARTLYARYIGS